MHATPVFDTISPLYLFYVGLVIAVVLFLVTVFIEGCILYFMRWRGALYSLLSSLLMNLASVVVGITTTGIIGFSSIARMFADHNLTAIIISWLLTMAVEIPILVALNRKAWQLGVWGGMIANTVTYVLNGALLGTLA